MANETDDRKAATGSATVEPELVREAQSGDALAMSKLLDLLAPRVGRICASIALDAGPDAAQEALIQVFRDLTGLREAGALWSWTRRIAVREAIRHAQRERRRVDLDRVRSNLPSPDDPTLAADIRSVLSRLGPEQRAILVLRDLEGLSEEEAAAQLGVARGTAKSRLHRARAAFMERWHT
jgi:RNA polymerase sigma factor (sigma-70 family)